MKDILKQLLDDRCTVAMENKTTQELTRALFDSLSQEQRESFSRLLAEKDYLICREARKNYKRGLRDGARLGELFFSAK